MAKINLVECDVCKTRKDAADSDFVEVDVRYYDVSTNELTTIIEWEVCSDCRATLEATLGNFQDSKGVAPR